MRFEKSFAPVVVAASLSLSPGAAVAQTHPEITVLDGLVLSGASLDASEIQAILLSGEPDRLALLAELDAQSITIETLEMARPDDSLDRGLVLTGIALTDISSGVAGSIRIDNLTFNDHDGSLTYDAVEIENLNFGAILGFADVIAPPQPGDYVPLYDSFRLGRGGYDGDLAKCILGGFDAGALTVLAGFDWDLMDRIEMEEGLSDEDRETLTYAAAFDIFAAFTLSHLEMGEIFCSALDPERGPIEVGIGGFSTGAFEPGLFPAMTISDMDYTLVEGPQAGTARFGDMTFDGMDYAHLLGSQVIWPDAGEFEKARRNMPHIFGFSMRDVEMDIPDGTNRIAITMDAFDVTLDNWLNGLPTSVSMSVDNQTMSLASGMDMFGYDEMLSILGLDTISSSFSFAGHWDPDAGTIAFDTAYDWPNLGSVSAAANFVGAREGLFSYDPGQMLIAAMGLGVTDGRLDLADSGALDIFGQVAAFERALSGADPRAALADEMMAEIDAEFPEPAIRAILVPLADFIRNGGRLTIEARAAGGQPVGMESFEAIDADPAALFEIFDLKAIVRPID